MELIRGRYRYRLAHAFRDDVGGGVNVLGEVATVDAVEQLLMTYARMGLADLVEDPDAGPARPGVS